MMLTLGYSLSGLIAVAIMFLGIRFWWMPASASAGFGISDTPPPSAALNAWLSVKGTRDIFSGLVVFLLMTSGPARLLGGYMLLASLIAFGDMATILRQRGNRALAFGMHGVTGLVILATGLCLIVGAK